MPQTDPKPGFIQNYTPPPPGARYGARDKRQDELNLFLKKARSKVANFFQEIEKGFEWVGKELSGAASWFPRIFTTVNAAEKDIPQITADVTKCIDSMGAVAAAAVKDSGTPIKTLEVLGAAIATAWAAKGINFTADTAVITAVQEFGEAITDSANFTDFISAVKTMTLDYETLGKQVKTDLAQLAEDVEGKSVAGAVNGTVETPSSNSPSTIEVETNTATVTIPVSTGTASVETIPTTKTE